MRPLILYACLLLLHNHLFSQILLEDKQGDQIANNAPFYTNTLNEGINTSLIKLNTGEQSLGFDYIVSSKNFNPSRYMIHEFGVKANSTDGFASLFSNGQFSPEINFTYSLIQVPLLKDRSGYIDWAGIQLGYKVSQYTLYSSNSSFDKQVFAENANAISVMLHYNALIDMIWIFNVKMGYARKDNFDYLDPVEVQDVATVIDPVTSIMRQTITTLSARKGEFRKFHSVPLIIAITRAAPTDSPGSPAASKLRLGYTAYIKNLASSELPDTRAGILFFLTNQDKSGIRSPVFGLDIQATDPFDVYDARNGIGNRLSIGFTTIFTL